MSRLLADDERCILLLGDIGVFGFRVIAEKKPASVLNMGILEQAMIGFAAGLAMDGRIPVVHSIAPFIVERCLEQLKIDFGYQQLSGKFVSVGASFDYASLGCTHHCPADIGTLLGIPGMEIVVPGNGEEFNILFTNSYDNGNSTYYRLSETTNVSTQDVSFGKACLLREGTQGTVVAIGPTLDLALNASEHLDVSVIYVTTLRPFDHQALREVTKNLRVFVFEPFYEGTVYPDVLTAFSGLKVGISGKGVPRRFLENYGTRDEHLLDLGFDIGIVRSELEAFFS